MCATIWHTKHTLQESQPEFRTYIRSEFDKWKDLSRLDVSRIEHLMRRGMRQCVRPILRIAPLLIIVWTFRRGKRGNIQ